MSRQQLIRNAELDVGYTESPRGSNRTKWGKEYGVNGLPWCGTWVYAKHRQVGVDLKKYCDNPFYTPNLFYDLQQRGWAVPENQAQPGDIVFMGFPGRRAGIEHVGLAVRVDYPSFVNIEGNTSGSNQSNGGMVQKRGRSSAQVLGVIHIPELILPNERLEPPKLPKPQMTPGALQTLNPVLEALFYCRQIVVSESNAPEAAVKFIQTGINNLHIPGIYLAVDGKWGTATEQAVRWVQATRGLVADGIVGPATWHLLYG